MVIAVLAGAATSAGFAPASFWPATLVGVVGFAFATVRAASPRRAGVAGLAFGAALTSITLTWMAMIDRGAMLGLILLVTGWYGALGVAMQLAGRSRWWPLLASGAWVLMEFAASRVPFGGFGWLRLGYALIDSPLAGLLPVVGVGGLGMAAALAANSVAWFLFVPSIRRGVASVTTSAVVLLAAAAGSAAPLPAAKGTVALGWVQGGAPGGGVYGIGRARSTTYRHTAQTAALAGAVRAGRVTQPDAVIWPENSTDRDATADPETRRLIEESVAAVRAPILVGTILDGPGPDQRRTTAQWWTDDGPGASYDKRSIVPFGEWIPYRDLLLPLVPQLRYVGAQSVPGQQPGVLAAPLPDGRRVSIGVLICFDVAFDPVVYDLAGNGAQVVVVQSSNAMYQGSAQVDQQFAITRARAAELGREVLVVTTSGISGMVEPTGKTRFRIDSGAGSGTVVLPTRSGETLASRLSIPLQQLVGAATLGWLAVLLLSGLPRGLGAGLAVVRNPRRARRGAAVPGTEVDDPMSVDS